MKDKFIGELRNIDPKKIVNENKQDNIGSFFLGLGVIFNDLKGLIWFNKMLHDHYEVPSVNEITSHAGNYTGIALQIQKLMAGIIDEFFIFIEKNNTIFQDAKFKEIFNKLSKHDQQIWNSVRDVATGSNTNAIDFVKTTIKIRSNLAFHYDHSGKILKRGYISRFYSKVKDSHNSFAYYSIGENIENIRFYFSDAALEEAIFLAAGKKEKEDFRENKLLKKYNSQILETINIMSITISSIMKKYMQFIRNNS
ncbi:MAG: hypothetical protein RBS77_03825 [Candidatus Moranbacteria bacterium]|jgi:hypothetical protein|nr:hypothetical protein [Candidatus Moranbacteria bacterium]